MKNMSREYHFIQVLVLQMLSFVFPFNVTHKPLFGNHGIGISASTSSLEQALASALQKTYFCLQKSLKNKIFMFFSALSYEHQYHFATNTYNAQKMKFRIKSFNSKCDQIRRI